MTTRKGRTPKSGLVDAGGGVGTEHRRIVRTPPLEGPLALLQCAPMRHWLVALFLCLCLPLPWAVAASAPPCAHGPCEVASVALVAGQATQATAHLGDLASQHPGCGCCHAGGSLAPAFAVPALGPSPCRVLVSWPVPWQERLFAARPERPQWAALA
jgi:hypothetical protein